jgi:Na+/proline symporter
MTFAIPIQIWMVIVYVAIFTVVGLWSSRKVKELSNWAPKIIPAISVIISFGAIVAPMFIAGFFWKRATGYGANASLIGGSLAFFAWVILRYPLGIRPIVPGMITATLALIIVSFATPPPKQRQLRFIQRLRGVQFEGESVLDEERAKKQETNQ